MAVNNAQCPGCKWHFFPNISYLIYTAILYCWPFPFRLFSSFSFYGDILAWFLFGLVLDRVSLCRPGWPGIHYVDLRSTCLCLFSAGINGAQTWLRSGAWELLLLHLLPKHCSNALFLHLSSSFPFLRIPVSYLHVIQGYFLFFLASVITLAHDCYFLSFCLLFNLIPLKK